MMTNPKAQAHGDGVGKPDGGGRMGGGESGGGAYKNQEDVSSDPDSRGFMGHGGQTDIAYRGTGDRRDGDDNPNSVTNHSD
jgi:hypothetical protein